MITIFACPKAFRGQSAILQRNAVISWTFLRPKPEIILFGDKEEGTAKICQEFGLRYIPEVSRNEFNTPLVRDLFEKGQRLAKYDLVCYVNSDIVLTQSLIRAVNIISERWKRFVAICSTWELAEEEKINFIHADWEGGLCNLVRKKGMPPRSIGIDLFLFRRGFYDCIPPFAIGRLRWDNWLIAKAYYKKIPLIDISQFTMAVHFAHERTSHSSRIYQIDKEGLINTRLISKWSRSFIGLDARYELKADGRLRKKRCLELLRIRLRNFIKSYPKLERICYLITHFK